MAKCNGERYSKEEMSSLGDILIPFLVVSSSQQHPVNSFRPQGSQWKARVSLATTRLVTVAGLEWRIFS